MGEARTGFPSPPPCSDLPSPGWEHVELLSWILRSPSHGFIYPHPRYTHTPNYNNQLNTNILGPH